MTQSNQWLQEEYTIDTPENVTFGYEVAGIGSRFIGAIIDTLMLALSLFALNLVLGFLLEWVGASGAAATFAPLDTEMSWVAGLVLAIYVLLNFLLVMGYYLIFELIWNGQTVGKRAAKIRVVRLNGNPAGFLEIVVRNLLRIVDFLPVGYGVGLVVMFFNRHARRLGDFAAGTIVIKEQADINLATLTQSNSTINVPTDHEIEVWRQQFPNLRQLTADDYELLQETLRRHDRGQVSVQALYRLCDVIAHKVATTPPTHEWQSSRSFLVEVLAAYRHLSS